MKKQKDGKSSPIGRPGKRAGPILKRSRQSKRKKHSRENKEGLPASFIKKVWADIVGRLQMMDRKKMMIGSIPYIIIFYVIEKEAWLYRHCAGNTMIQKLMNLFLYFGVAFRSPVPSFFWWDMAVGVTGAAAFWAFISYRRKNAKKYRQGVEYGSARWGAYYQLQGIVYGRKGGQRHDAVQQDHRAILPPFSW